jgi:hypothetical protein
MLRPEKKPVEIGKQTWHCFKAQHRQDAGNPTVRNGGSSTGTLMLVNSVVVT